jgi:hypothetical protein
MKENDGRASRRKTTRRFLYGVGLVAVALAVIMLRTHWADDDPATNARLLRQARKHAMLKRHNQRNQDNDMDKAQVIKGVLAGELHLIDLTVEENELIRAPSNSYAGVYGKFCELDWSRRKVDPSAGRWLEERLR